MPNNTREGALTMEDPQALFDSAVPFYARYRSGYPTSDVEVLASRLRLSRSQRVVDVGCGCGQMSIPLARYVARVIAVDPLAAMLASGRRIAQAAGVTNITWVQGDAGRIAELVEPGTAMACFAASFHWTERPAVVEALDGLLAPGGSIVVINDVLGEPEQPDWVNAIAEIRTRYLGDDPGGTNTYVHPSQSHQQVLDDSPFSSVREWTWSWTRRLTIDEVVGLQFSYSFSTPALLGERVDAFADEVRAAVTALYPAGLVTEPFRVEVLAAARP